MHHRGATKSPPTPTPGRRRTIDGSLAFALAALVLMPLSQGAEAQGAAFAERELSELEADTERLMLQPVSVTDRRSDTFVE